MAERFTAYEGVMSDPDLTVMEKIIHLQKAITNATRRKMYFASLQGKFRQNCFVRLKKAYKKTLEEVKIERRWVEFSHKLHKLVLKVNQLQYCTVSLCFIHNNFKVMKEICNGEPDYLK